MLDIEDYTFSVDDESTWRVTDQYPARDMDGMNWERCAVLHNQIFKLAWEGSGRLIDVIDSRTWWDVYITDDEIEARIAKRLTPSLIKFLKHAHAGNQQQNPCFFFYAQGLLGEGTLGEAKWWPG